MILNEELLAVQRGEQGEAMRKVLNTLVMYGEAFGAERMVKITGKMGHAVIGTGSMTWKPVFDLMEELIAFETPEHVLERAGWTHLYVAEDEGKIIGCGDLSKKLNVKVDAYSASAKAKIEAAGGTAEVAE